LVVPLSGWVLVSVSVLEIPSVPFGLFLMPNLPLLVSEHAEKFWIAGHQWLAYAGIALVVLHVLAALRHHFLLRDVVLARMISPFIGSRAQKPE
jgi:cytochrome b561